jgi:CHAT domain-containing protein
VLEEESKALYKILIKPLEPYIKGKKQIYISPDGDLNRIPFEVLMTAGGKYVIEEHAINYIGAGRDIVRFTDTNIAKGPTVIIADPDYDMGLIDKEAVAGKLVVKSAVRGIVSRDLKGMKFTRLQDTKKEADAIANIIAADKKAYPQNFQGRKANEEILFSVESPRILHIATHGYFLRKEEDPGAGIPLMSGNRDRTSDSALENPMLRSGIVLAGANASLAEGRDDGLVSAEKILGLKLQGTELVVLSACDTGVGDIQTGEGVFGLKRAFILSGAKTLVMSLWSVPSQETTELMTEFYRFMSEGKTKSEALRQAKMNMMSKKPNPFYWGAFVMTGNPD